MCRSSPAASTDVRAHSSGFWPSGKFTQVACERRAPDNNGEKPGFCVKPGFWFIALDALNHIIHLDGGPYIRLKPDIARHCASVSRTD